MRVLLDENLAVDFAAELAGHEVATVSGEGWQGIDNGELLRRAQSQFEILVTMDRNLEFQRNLTGLDLSILLVLAPSNRLAHLRSYVPAILEAMKSIQPGELRRVGPQ